MGDQFEKFIHENRERFESDFDGDRAWTSIEESLEGKGGFQWQWVWKVAAVVFLISTVVLVVDRSNRVVPTTASIYEEFVEAESFYTTLITQKKLEIEGFGQSDLSVEFLQEIDALGDLYEGLKVTFGEQTSDKKIIDAMIGNLQLRIEILNRQLVILQQLNDSNNENSTDIEI